MPKQWPYKYQLYKHLQLNSQKIFAEMRQAGQELGITPDLNNQIGLTGAISGCHGLLTSAVADAMNQAARKVIPSSSLDEQLRDEIKAVYGDEYDAALVNTCEAGLATSFDTLFTPPLAGRGEGYRGRYITFYERFIEHHTSYGRPFPPKYKEYCAERGETAGEYGIQGKRLNNLDTIYVRMEGATYDCHGIKYDPIPNLIAVDGQKTIDRVAEIAARHADSLVGFASLGYETPGYGYGDKNADGVPVIQTGLSALAKKYDLPYLVDNAWGMPFLGADIRKLGCDVMTYSMDKVSGSPTCGLIIGKEESMVTIRRALGIHGARYGTLSSHGKAAYVGFDAGKEALVGTIAALQIIRAHPEVALKALDDLHAIILEEFEKLPAVLKPGWKFYKSINAMAVELNYYGTWANNRMGIPIFSMEDMYAGSNLIMAGLSQMGVMPTTAFDGNIIISNGLGNIDENGGLVEKPTRLAVAALFKCIEIISRYAGLLD